MAEFWDNCLLWDEGCWLWLGTLNEKVRAKFKGDYAYRWAYRTFIGPIPTGFDIDHLCDHPWCVNPDHLEAVTPAVNRQRQRERWIREHPSCPQGHLYSEENTYLYVTKRGSVRMCRACAHLRNTSQEKKVYDAVRRA